MIMRNIEEKFNGCDFVVRLEKERKNTKIKLLQLTDMQIIDSFQRRTPDRLRIDEINSWNPAHFDEQCGDGIRSLVAQTNPDLIFITGDIIYGSFDDNGTTFEWFVNFMDSLEIPWAPVFGNHDNESLKGVQWQCQKFADSKFCLFKRGNVSGNGNYTVGIAVEDELIRVLHMIDSNGCGESDDPEIIKEEGIFPDQIELIKENTLKIKEAQKKEVPAFIAFHIPTIEFFEAEKSKGYVKDEYDFYTLGVNVTPKDGDFGTKRELYKQENIVKGEYLQHFKDCGIDGVFVGHCHSINTCILYEGIKWVFGLKTGQYDYHIPYAVGGTLITLEDKDFYVSHVPCLVNCTNFPIDMRMFKGFFADDKKIIE